MQNPYLFLTVYELEETDSTISGNAVVPCIAIN